MIQFELADDSPVYVISVAAQMSGLHAQTLRTYDRLGLVSPGRAAGGGRRYSLRDILALREVQRLSKEGVSPRGIKRILELEDEQERHRVLLAELHAEITQLRTELEDAPLSAQPADQAHAGGTGPTSADSSRAAKF